MSLLSGPVLADGVVYVSADRYLYVVDAETGDQLWRVETSAGTLGTPLIWGQRAYVGSSNGYLYAIDISD